jgi:hypothetical protein
MLKSIGLLRIFSFLDGELVRQLMRLEHHKLYIHIKELYV